MPQPPNSPKNIPTQPLAPATSPHLSARAHEPRKFWIGLAGWLLLAGSLTILFINRQAISDWWQLRDYQPPAAIEQLAVQDTMTDEAKHLFYLNRPQLVASVSNFRKGCPDNRENVVLGCYHSNQKGIYIYNVKDPDLQGIAQVTAAHEMLHAAYERLSSEEKRHVNTLLKDYYEHRLTDERVKKEIQFYQKTEPHDIWNEMHSIFATEIAELPRPLETYYKQYFNDRHAVVAFEKQYERAFSARQAVIRATDEQLAAMRVEIEARQARLDGQRSELQATKNRLDALLAAGESEAYNGQIGAYNTQVNAYNSSVAALRTYIEDFNRIVANRNTVAEQLNILNRAVDTRQVPATTQ